MPSEYVLLAIIISIAVFLLLMRSDLSVVFFSLCAGSLLVIFSGTNVELLVSSLTSGASWLAQYARVSLLLIPFIFAVVMTRKRSNPKLFLVDVILSIVCSSMIFVLSFDLLPSYLTSILGANSLWLGISNYSEFTFVGGLFLSMLMVKFNAGTKSRRRKTHHWY